MNTIQATIDIASSVEIYQTLLHNLFLSDGPLVNGPINLLKQTVPLPYLAHIPPLQPDRCSRLLSYAARSFSAFQAAKSWAHDQAVLFDFNDKIFMLGLFVFTQVFHEYSGDIV